MAASSRVPPAPARRRVPRPLRPLLHTQAADLRERQRSRRFAGNREYPGEVRGERLPDSRHDRSRNRQSAVPRIGAAPRSSLFLRMLSPRLAPHSSLATPSVAGLLPAGVWRGRGCKRRRDRTARQGSGGLLGSAADLPNHVQHFAGHVERHHAVPAHGRELENLRVRQMVVGDRRSPVSTRRYGGGCRSIRRLLARPRPRR